MSTDDGPMAVLSRLEAKIDSLEAKIEQHTPMTPGRAAAEARQAMTRGHEAAAEERAAKASEDPDGGDDE